MRKRKREKVIRAKDEEVNGQGRNKGGKGVPRPHAGSLAAKWGYYCDTFSNLYNNTAVCFKQLMDYDLAVYYLAFGRCNILT